MKIGKNKYWRGLVYSISARNVCVRSRLIDWHLKAIKICKMTNILFLFVFLMRQKTITQS